MVGNLRDLDQNSLTLKSVKREESPGLYRMLQGFSGTYTHSELLLLLLVLL